MTPEQVRQGNLLLTPAKLPPTARMTQRFHSEDGRVVLSHGETGGSHEFRSERVRVWEDGGETYIEVLGDRPVALEHTTPRHDTAPLNPGTYRFSEAREAPPPRTGAPPRRSPD
jgi:hypothetical protein